LTAVALQVLGDDRLGERPAGEDRGQMQVDECRQLRQLRALEGFDMDDPISSSQIMLNGIR
jgi:hypothetical protein